MGDTVYHDWASGAGAGALFEGSDLAIRGASRGKILHYLSNVELVRKVEDLRRQIEILRTDLQRTRQHEACLQKIIDAGRVIRLTPQDSSKPNRGESKKKKRQQRTSARHRKGRCG